MFLILSIYSGNWEQILCFPKMEKEPGKHNTEAYMDSLFFWQNKYFKYGSLIIYF